MEFQFTPEGVCSRGIMFNIDEHGTLHNVRFAGGCNGNTHGVAALAEGRKVKDVIECLRGIDCKGRGTSCPDQLARALSEATLKCQVTAEDSL